MTMSKKLLLATGCVMALVVPGHADFEMRGVMKKLLSNGQVSCSRYTEWVKTHPDEREVMNQWILGFYNGVEAQLTEEPRHAKATGSEQSDDAILNMVKFFCKKEPKQAALAIISLGVDYWLTKSINPRYDHGFNGHGVLGTTHSTCQNLIMEVEGEWGSMKGKPASPERKFLLEEWMLGFASGVESQVLYGKSQRTDKVSNEELLDSIYATCRANPTEPVAKVVLDQELANIEAIDASAGADATGKYWGDVRVPMIADSCSD